MGDQMGNNKSPAIEIPPETITTNPFSVTTYRGGSDVLIENLHMKAEGLVSLLLLIDE